MDAELFGDVGEVVVVVEVEVLEEPPVGVLVSVEVVPGSRGGQ